MSYGGEIATAFVRIRPNLAGFKEQATAGVRGGLEGMQAEVRAATEANVANANETVAANRRVQESFYGIGKAAEEQSVGVERLRGSVGELAKIVGVAFGAEILVHFGKSIVEHAASVQKQMEVVRAEFGKGAESVLAFSEKGAAALGVSAHAAETAAARMGILFNNLNIGKQKAAAATIDLIKLAGSLSAIRGIDPATVLQSLPLAIAGNLRSLKQLGIATDQNQLKVAAFRLGLTQTISQGLTPAQRALAIVAVATAKLGQYQAQAAAHAGDAANVMRRLSAEWDNAKDKLGAGLLPAVVSFTTFLADKLPTAIEKTRKALHDFGATIGGIARFVAPVFAPISHALTVIRADLSSGGGFGKLKDQFASLSPVAKAAAVAVAYLGVTLAAAFAAAFPISATIAAIFGLGIALDEAYKHSARFREIVQDLRDWLSNRLLPAIEELARRVGPTLAIIEAQAKKIFGDIVVIVERLVKDAEIVWARFGTTIKRITKDAVGGALVLVINGFKQIGLAFDTVKDLLTGKWSNLWGDLKGIVKVQLDSVKTVIGTFGSAAFALFEGIWKNIEYAAIKSLATITGYLAQIPTQLHAFGLTIGPKNPFVGITKSLNDQLDSMTNSARWAKVRSQLKDELSGISGAFSKAFKDAKNGVLSDLPGIVSGSGNIVKDGVAKATKAGTVAAVAAADQQLADLRTKLRDLIAQNAIALHDAVQSAKQNLLQIGGTLASQIGQVVDQPFVVAQTKIQDAQDRLSLIYDRKNAKLQAQANRLNALSAQLSQLSAKHNLNMLRQEVALPGGEQLSLDPKKATKQLMALAKGANALTRPAIEDFILQYRGALLSVAQGKLGLKSSALDARNQAATTRLQLSSDALRVAQDTANHIKTIATRSIADFTAKLASGAITLKTFNRKLAHLLATDHVSYKKAGSLLGTAFASGFAGNIAGIRAQAAALGAYTGPHVAGTGQEPKIVRPEITFQKQTLQVARLQHQIAARAAATQKKQLAAEQKTAQQTQAIHTTQLGQTSKALGKNPGGASHKTREMQGTTG